MQDTIIIIIPILVMIFIRMKYVELILRPLNTLIHELSHAVVALLLGEKIKDIKINPDYSGSCTTKSKSKFKAFCVSIVGYVIPSLLGYLIICELQNTMLNLLFYILIGVNIFALVFYIRNTFGIIWVLSFSMINILFLYIPMFKPLQPYILYFYSCVLLVENMLATLSLLKINLVSAKDSGDSYNLQKLTHIPALVYSLLFVGYAFMMICFSFNSILQMM